MKDVAQATKVMFSSESNEYFTPEIYIEAARDTMGGIDLDPASHPYPQRWIKAKRFYTPEDDGLSKPWSGRVWLNPPYGRGHKNRSNQDLWTGRLIDFWEYGDVQCGIALVRAALGYNWFEDLFARFWVAFTRDRIRFLTVDGQMHPAKVANAFVLICEPRDGFYPERFKRTFDQFGRVVPPAGVLDDWHSFYQSGCEVLRKDRNIDGYEYDEN